MIDIIYLHDERYGGRVTFLEHLCRQVGEYRLFCIGNTPEMKTRSLASLEYQNVTLPDLHRRDRSKMLIAAVDYQSVWMLDQLKGATLVVHNVYDSLRMPTVRNWPKIVVPRMELLRVFPQAKFIRHPYCRDVPNVSFDALMRDTTRTQLDPMDREMIEHPREHPWNAACFSRIDFGKNTEMICEANKMGAEIQLFGHANRSFVRRPNLNYPGWSRYWWGRFPHVFNAGVIIAREAKWVVDLSVLRRDGGGTQYTFLEAWNAGRMTILHEEWRSSVSGVCRFVEGNSTFVQSAEELCDAVTHDPSGLKPYVDWSLFETGKEFVDVVQG